MNNTEAKKIMKHILARQKHARSNPDGTMSLVFSWKGTHQIATFHQTIDDLMDDTWSVQVNTIGEMQLIIHSNDPIQYNPIDEEGEE